MQWYESNLSVIEICKSPNPVPKSSFQRHLNDSGLSKLKQENGSIDRAHIIFSKYIEKRISNQK